MYHFRVHKLFILKSNVFQPFPAIIKPTSTRAGFQEFRCLQAMPSWMECIAGVLVSEGFRGASLLTLLVQTGISKDPRVDFPTSKQRC